MIPDCTPAEVSEPDGPGSSSRTHSPHDAWPWRGPTRSPLIRKRDIPSWAVLTMCCAAQFMVVLDVSIINVALPSMRASLNLSATDQQWIINAYTLTYAGFLLLGGRASDLVGRRRAFAAGLCVFTTSSLLGGLARTGGWLIAARAVQGVGGAVLVPATLSLITTTFIEHSARRRAVGAWSAVAASGSAAGVLAGGVLTDLLDWRWVLFVNVPIGVALITGTAVSSEECRAERRPGLDVAGAVTATGGLALVVYGVVNTATRAWTAPATVLTLLGGAVLLVAFVVIESRVATDPLVPLGVFRLSSVAAANGLAVTIGAAVYALFFFMSLYLQQVNGYTPLEAGLAFLPAALSVLTGALVATRIAAHLGIRLQLVLGSLIAAAGLAWLTQLAAGDNYATHVLGPLVLAGTGFGLSFVPLALAATADVPAHQAGVASGLLNTSRQLGGAVGLAAMATISARAASPTAGYDRAFGISATTLVIGSAFAVLLLSGRAPKRSTTRSVSTADLRDVLEASDRLKDGSRCGR